MTPNKERYAEPERNLTDLLKKVSQLSLKGYDFLLGRMHFTDDDGYQNFLVIAPILNWLIWDTNKNVTNWILTEISSQKIKPLEPTLVPIMSILAKDRMSIKLKDLKFNANSIINLYMVYELNNWPNIPSNNFTLKNFLIGTVRLTRNAIKSKFIYICQGMTFDGAGSWRFGNNSARNAVMFGVKISSLSHTDN